MEVLDETDDEEERNAKADGPVVKAKSVAEVLGTFRLWLSRSGGGHEVRRINEAYESDCDPPWFSVCLMRHRQRGSAMMSTHK